MIRKKLSKMSVILLLFIALMPLYNSVHFDSNPSHEQEVILIDNMEDFDFMPK